MNNSTLINGTNMDTEYFTPPFILNRVHSFLGGIELDPASSEQANQTVRANRFFTKEMNAMEQEWKAYTVWMNHPFGRAQARCRCLCDQNHVHHSFDLHGNKVWVNRFVKEFMDGNFQHGICITYACTSEAWFQPLMKYPQCFLSPRTNYLLPDGTVKKGVTKGSVLTYLGSDWHGFRESFKDLGAVKF